MFNYGHNLCISNKKDINPNYRFKAAKKLMKKSENLMVVYK